MTSWQSGDKQQRKSMFQTRHYEAVAKLLREVACPDTRVIPGRARLPLRPPRTSKVEYHEEIVRAFCELFGADNPRFRCDAFRAAVNRRDE